MSEFKQEYVKYTCEQCNTEVVIDDINSAEADFQMYNWHTLYRPAGDKKHFCSFKCLGEWTAEDKGLVMKSKKTTETKPDGSAAQIPLKRPCLYAERDDVIRKIWCLLNKISHTVSIDDFTDEDMKLWTAVTEHSAVQDRLNKSI